MKNGFLMASHLDTMQMTASFIVFKGTSHGSRLCQRRWTCVLRLQSFTAPGGPSQVISIGFREQICRKPFPLVNVYITMENLPF